MGADLITAIAAKPTGAPIHPALAHTAVDLLTEEELQDCWMAEIHYPDDTALHTEQLEEIRAFLHVAVDHVARYWESRSRVANVYRDPFSLGYDILVVGERTWGDPIEEVDTLAAITTLPRVAAAFGMKPDPEEVTNGIRLRFPTDTEGSS